MKNPITMTATEAASALRKYGMRISIGALIDGIADGVYPFGRIVSVGDTGRRHVEIFRVKFCQWLNEMTVKEEEQCENRL